MHTRRGMILILVLVCLAVAAALVGVAVRRAVAAHCGEQLAEQSLQAAWLAESALERASIRLTADPQYSGETWSVPAEELDGRHAGKVVIAVGPVADQTRRRSVRVTADFPDDPHLRARRTKEIVIDLTP